jgi:hypothetical protein
MVNLALTGDGVFGADMTLSFDPASVRILQVSEGGFLSQDGQVTALVQKIEPETGTARISIERPPGTPAISGKGVLVTMILEPGRQKGDSLIRVVDFRVRDARQNMRIGKPAEIRISVP